MGSSLQSHHLAKGSIYDTLSNLDNDDENVKFASIQNNYSWVEKMSKQTKGITLYNLEFFRLTMSRPDKPKDQNAKQRPD